MYEGLNKVKLDPAIASLISGLLEKALAEILTSDPGTKARLAKLNGKSVLLEILEPQLHLGILFSEDTLSIRSYYSEEDLASYDLKLSGKLSDFIKLASKDSFTLAESGVTVDGSVGLLQRLSEIFKDIDLDWQDLISNKFKMLPAFYFTSAAFGLGSQPIAHGFKKSREFIADSINSSLMQASEFAKYESKLIVTKSEFDIFSDEALTIRQASDRLEARINKYLNNYAASQ